MAESESFQTPRIRIIHTVQGTIRLLTPIAKQQLPFAKVDHILDSRLLDLVAPDCQAQLEARLIGHIREAERDGCFGLLMACSSVGGVFMSLADRAHIPLRRIDKPMSQLAIVCGQKICVLASSELTVPSTTALLEESAAEQCIEVSVESHVVEGASVALEQNDTARLTHLVWGEANRLSDGVDVVVLAQASMGCVCDASAVRLRDGTPMICSSYNGILQFDEMTRRFENRRS
jgi:Asp/Glu/hydantoin racemase